MDGLGRCLVCVRLIEWRPEVAMAGMRPDANRDKYYVNQTINLNLLNYLGANCAASTMILKLQPWPTTMTVKRKAEQTQLL